MVDFIIYKKFYFVDLFFKCYFCIMVFGSFFEFVSYQDLYSYIFYNRLFESLLVIFINGVFNLVFGLKMVEFVVVKEGVVCVKDDKVGYVNGKVYVGELYLDIDKLMKVVSKFFKCSECSKVFVFINEFVGYVRIYIGERLFKCFQCDNCYRISFIFFVYMKSYMKEKCYKCSYCEVRCFIFLMFFDYFKLYYDKNGVNSWQENGYCK